MSVLIKKYGFDTLNKCHIGYNRNFYDFVPKIINILKCHNEFIIQANLSDQFKKLIKKKGVTIKPYLKEYMTSHWISFIYIILKNLKLNIKKNIINNQKGNLKSISYSLIKKNKLVKNKQLNINFIPNSPKNLSIEIFLEDLYINISPLEKMKIINKIEFVQNKKENIYVERVQDTLKVDKKYKPGFKMQYIEFINSCFGNKYKKNYSIT